jgi:hypothetical protein
MSKQRALTALPDSPGAWIACFRQRVSLEGKPPSPEQFGPLIGRHGVTVRRWEGNHNTPNEREIARIAQVAGLSAQQVAFLSAACTHMRAMPAPDEREFKEYMTDVLSSTPYPAMLIDGLFYVRAWNSYVEAVAPGLGRGLSRDLHAIALMLRADPRVLFRPERHVESLRDGIRIFWMLTAIHSHRPEYQRLIARLAEEPLFSQLWLELAFGCDETVNRPISFAHSIAGSGAQFNVYSRTISFPPSYHLNEYIPDDNTARERLAAVAAAGPPRVSFASRLHWVDPEPFDYRLKYRRLKD